MLTSLIYNLLTLECLVFEFVHALNTHNNHIWGSTMDVGMICLSVNIPINELCYNLETKTCAAIMREVFI